MAKNGKKKKKQTYNYQNALLSQPLQGHTHCFSSWNWWNSSTLASKLTTTNMTLEFKKNKIKIIYKNKMFRRVFLGHFHKSEICL